jgi:hypothetical protein
MLSRAFWYDLTRDAVFNVSRLFSILVGETLCHYVGSPKHQFVTIGNLSNSKQSILHSIMPLVQHVNSYYCKSFKLEKVSSTKVRCITLASVLSSVVYYLPIPITSLNYPPVVPPIRVYPHFTPRTTYLVIARPIHVQTRVYLFPDEPQYITRADRRTTEGNPFRDCSWPGWFRSIVEAMIKLT